MEARLGGGGAELAEAGWRRGWAKAGGARRSMQGRGAHRRKGPAPCRVERIVGLRYCTGFGVTRGEIV